MGNSASILRIVVAAMISWAATPAVCAEEMVEIDRIEKVGLKLTLPEDEEWELDEEGYYADEFGGSYQVAIDHGGGKKQVARIFIISARPNAMGVPTVAAWAREHVLGQKGNGAGSTFDKAGYLWWYSEKRGFDTAPQWTEVTTTLASGHSVTALNTPTVVINGNKRQMKAAYVASSTAWHTLFVFNVGTNESFDDEWAAILGGLVVSDGAGTALAP